MKVKIFDCENEKDLEKEINEFIENTKDIEVVDIKYNTTFKSRDRWGDETYRYSALIMYQYRLVMTVEEARREILTIDDLEKYIREAECVI